MAKKSRKVFATTATAALVASAVAPIASSAAGFSDVTKPEYKTAIDALAQAGILNGYENGTFKPENKVTRGEVAKVITLIRHLEEGTKTPFKDVKDGYWSTQYINSLYAAKLVNGYEDGTFKPEGNVTRAEFAKLVVDAYGLTLTNAATPFTDVKAGNWATPYIQTAYANGLIKGVTASKFDPSAPIKRGDLAILLHRADSKFGDVIGNNFPGVETVKAPNATTVEVTFKNAVDAKDVKASDYSIEGLTVSNAAVKQTDSKTVVLTTSTQEGGKQYTVKRGAATLGKFIGASAVIPTSIKMTTPSVQGTIGKEVTVKAEVTVPEGKSKAGIPVTFNIVNDTNNQLNEKIEVVAYTNEDGVASYSYTRYYKHNDSVTAYASDKSSVFAKGTVYWAQSLSLTEVTSGNELANGAKKVYKVSSPEYANGYVNIAFAENVDVAPDKLVRTVTVTDVGADSNKYPYQVTTGGSQTVKVKLDGKGEGTFTLTGSNASVTPIVYIDGYFDTYNVWKDGNGKLDAQELQAKAATVKFSLSHTLGVDVKAEGKQNAASITDKGKGGREYTVTITDKDGKVAPKGTVAYVTFKKDSLSKDKAVFIDDARAVEGKAYAIKVTNDKGQASFVLTGEKDGYATPTVYVDNGSKAGELDDNDLQKTGEITYFVNAVVENATLVATDGKGNEVTSLTTDKQAVFVYQSVDQNEFDYYAGDGDYEVTFQVTAQFGDVKVSGGATAVTVKKGTTESVKVKATKGAAKLYVEAVDGVSSNITVDASSSLVSLPNKSVKFSFVNAKELPSYYTGVVESINLDKKTITFAGFDPVSYSKSTSFKNASGVKIDRAEFENLINGTTGTSVTAVKDSEGIYSFEIYKLGTPVATITVTGAKAVDANKISVSFSDGTTKEFTLDKALVEGKNTVTVNYLGKDYSVAVDYNPNATLDVTVEAINGMVNKDLLGSTYTVAVPLEELQKEFKDATETSTVKIKVGDKVETLKYDPTFKAFFSESLTYEKDALLKAIITVE